MGIIGKATFAARTKGISGIAHDHGHGLPAFLHHLEKDRWFGPENLRPHLKVRGMPEEVRRQLELAESLSKHEGIRLELPEALQAKVDSFKDN
jgi:hypothetical protein